MMRIPIPAIALTVLPPAPVSFTECRWAAARLLLAPLAALATSAHALGLGEVAAQSAFGTSLRVVVPLIVGPAEEVSGECLKLVPAQRSSDGIPEVLTARIALERTPTGATIVVASPRAVTDPVLKLTLQAGCEGGVRREYVLLMDPPPIDVPLAQESAGAPTAAAAGAVAVPRAAAGAGATAAGSPSVETAAPRAPARRRVAAAPANKAGRAAPAPKSGAVAGKSAPKSATAVAAPRPKLTVSSAAPMPASPGTGVGPAAATAALSAPGGTPQPDTSAVLDAEAAALQQRVTELTAMVDRMQQQLHDAEALQAAQAARIAADEAAKASPQALVGRWWAEGWPFLAALVALAVLIAALLAMRRRRATVASGQWRLEAATHGKTEAPKAAPRPAPPPPAPKPVTAAAAQPQAGAALAAATSVDVSELSHVTEEAGVYLAFNRPDRAIEVLRGHIRTSPHSLPAAWLMLLDVYHAEGREEEFRELAQRFHAQFNAQTPGWETYRQQAQSDRGLEAFPHVIPQLVGLWGKPECRDFLDHLLHENRDGRRSGFSLAAYEDILMLRQLVEIAAAEGGAAARPQVQKSPAPAVPTPPAPAPAPSAAALLAKTTRPPTLDLELALDEDMLESGKSPSAGDAAPPPKYKPKES